MQSPQLGNVERKLACLQRIATSSLDDVRQFLLANIVETYATLSEDEQERYAIELAAERGQEVRAMQLTWAEKHYYRGWDEGLDKGRKEGRLEGRQEGELEGRRKTLQSLIEHRLGTLSEAQQERLGAIRDAAMLDKLARRLLDARSFDDLGLD